LKKKENEVGARKSVGKKVGSLNKDDPYQREKNQLLAR